jgi:hypothetical protein
MPPKPHRVFVDRVSGYADEASNYLRRRQIARRPFARVYADGGRVATFAAESEHGRKLFLAASRVIDVARDSGGTGGKGVET